MLFFNSVLLLSLGVLCSATEDDICKDGRPRHCFVDIPEAPKFPDSEEALDKICPLILPALKCVIDFKNKCPDTAEPTGLDEHLDDIYAVLENICDKDSKLNKALAIHLPCIEKNLEEHEATCKPIVKEVLEEMTSHLNLDWDSEDVFPNVEDRAKYYCARESLDMSCFVASTSVKCGEEAADISEYLIERVGFLEAVCPENIRDDVKALVALVQPLMELGIAAEELKKK